MVPGDEHLATQSTVITILSSGTLHVYLWVVPGDETLATQSTMIQILSSMTVHVSLYMVLGDKFLARQSIAIWIDPYNDSLCVFFVWFLEINSFPHRPQ